MHKNQTLAERILSPEWDQITDVEAADIIRGFALRAENAHALVMR